MDDNELFPKRLQIALGEESIRAFARKADISDGALRQYLSGKSEPTRPVLIRIAKVAGVSLEWLLTGEGSKTSNVSDHGDSSLLSYIRHVFVGNRRRGKGWNSDSVFLAGFSFEHREILKQVAIKAAEEDGRPAFFVDATKKTLIQIAEEYTEGYYRTNYEAFNAIEERIINLDEVVILANISASKIKDKTAIVKELIKILDDGKLRGTQPLADLVFIDNLGFLEKSWGLIGDYIQTNIAFS